MNTANIKKYAPKARQDFIAAMTKQAALYGVTAKGCEPMEIRGDLALIGSRTFAKSISRARDALVKRIEQIGFAQTMEQAAYSWFNRLCAIRYMEIQGYLDHGRRVLSTASGEAGTPQVLDDCLDIELPGLDKAKVADLKLDGTQDEALYRELLLAQCHALHEAMPFLFEELDDATELLLPDNLTKTDSLIRALVSAIPEEDWQDVEIIGWLYQFYISEKKDQVIGKVVKSEDIPAATQLFTPNWIVQYLVQNSVGRQWLQTYPDSPLKDQMPYYIAPGEQPADVQAQLDAVTSESIDPESIKVLDPACGSGHILVEAYKLLKSIYEERGYRTRDIPRMILNHNLFGLDIDDRAGQLAGFALMMLARQDDRRLFSRVASGDVSLNVLSLQETGHLDLNQLWRSLNLGGEWQQGSSQSLFESEQADLSSAKADNRYQLLERTLARFNEAKTFGSLIEVPAEDAEPLKQLLDELTQLAKEGDSMQKPAALQLLPYVQQARVLAQRYDAVIANPPYMSSKGMNNKIKDFAKSYFPDAKGDLFALFIERSFGFLKENSLLSMVTMQSWMFLSSYKNFRKNLLGSYLVKSVAHLGPNAFPEITGPAIQVCCSIFSNLSIQNYFPVFGDYIRGDSISKSKSILNKENLYNKYSIKDFYKVPGLRLAYWISSKIFSSFDSELNFEDALKPRQGMATSDNNRFLRQWWEVSSINISWDSLTHFAASKSGCEWFPYNKGGPAVRWYGNRESVVKWGNEGKELLDYAKELYGSPTRTIKNVSLYFGRGITWGDITFKNKKGEECFAARLSPGGCIFDINGPTGFPNEDLIYPTIAILNSKVLKIYMSFMNPSSHFQVGDIKEIPYLMSPAAKEKLSNLAKRAIDISYELYSMDETSPSCEGFKLGGENINDFCFGLISNRNKLINDLSEVETGINIACSELYSVSDEVDPTVSVDDVTFPKLNTSQLMLDIMSRAIGYMLGRYAIDKPGLILASQGETLQDYLNQIPSPRFMPDDDAILPLTDQEWFADDATNRFREFVRVVWGDEYLQENLDFVAESLSLHAIKAKRGESALDTIRRYLSTQFYKDHMRTYKKRPIYWLFSSGKQKAFECLVYLHRYNEGTLARMRTEYVIPLTAKLSAYAEKLEQDKAASASAAETKRLEKEINTLHKQQAELAEFDEKLRHYADQRISLDLDDGVKVNYGKFGDLLANVKEVTGKAPS